MEIRKEGYYWVKYGEWTIGLWSSHVWEIVGSDYLKSDEDFAEIDERQIVREKEITPPEYNNLKGWKQ